MENKLHILVVDDDDKIRNLLKEYLNSNNYIVTTAIDAENAKIKLGHFKFDIIVLDVMMPGKDGYQLTKEIKKDLSVPIILLTAKGEVENRIKGLEIGADDYLGKPFEPKELLLRIKNIVNKNKKFDGNKSYNIGPTKVDLKKMYINLNGKNVFEVLSKGSPFDFNKFKNTKNVVVQTLLNHVDVILHHNDIDNVDLFVRKSFSEYLWLWINDSSSFLQS